MLLIKLLRFNLSQHFHFVGALSPSFYTLIKQYINIEDIHILIVEFIASNSGIGGQINITNPRCDVYAQVDQHK